MAASTSKINDFIHATVAELGNIGILCEIGDRSLWYKWALVQGVTLTAPTLEHLYEAVTGEALWTPEHARKFREGMERLAGNSHVRGPVGHESRLLRQRALKEGVEYSELVRQRAAAIRLERGY
jgi:hypothetical protein